MFSLIIAVISIAFMASILVAGMNYVSFDSVQGIRDGSQIYHGVVQLSTGYLTFRELHRDEPESIADLVPSLMKAPPLPKGLEWFYDETGRSWFCVSGPIDRSTLAGIRRAKESLPDEAAFLSTSCGATANEVLPTELPATVALTYYVRHP